MDQLYQSALIVNPKTLQIQDRPLRPKDRIQRNSDATGFRFASFSLAGKSKMQKLDQMTGQLADQEHVYLKITSNHQQYLSKKDYKRALNKVFHSKLPQRTQLMRIQLTLIYEGQRKLALIGDEQVDYSPANMKPTSITIQYKQAFRPRSSTAKQTWASVSELEPHRLSIDSRSYRPSDLPDNQNEPLFDDSNQTNINYNVNWRQPAFLQDLIGLNFTYVTEFEVPKNSQRADVYIQQAQPNLSKQLTYTFK
ncbi:hypothetical protein [Sporolactobacillus laevolacticus]|uniref:hypothetical protein n=1 Tax=Sporolactobacillus laevolacticus TaxID=33018 RepID=UPI0025B5A6A3|nr:hypothetical protein [Sporolactobacillus laevolacticus]MDN3954446.1 hypothetical protein [Sporolactobacillus laevolacticus]